MNTARLPLFVHEDLERARQERAELMAMLRRHGIEVHSRIRTEQKLKLIVAKIIRLEQELGAKH